MDSSKFTFSGGGEGETPNPEEVEAPRKPSPRGPEASRVSESKEGAVAATSKASSGEMEGLSSSEEMPEGLPMESEGAEGAAKASTASADPGGAADISSDLEGLSLKPPAQGKKYRHQQNWSKLPPEQQIEIKREKHRRYRAKQRDLVRQGKRAEAREGAGASGFSSTLQDTPATQGAKRPRPSPTPEEPNKRQRAEGGELPPKKLPTTPPVSYKESAEKGLVLTYRAREGQRPLSNADATHLRSHVTKRIPHAGFAVQVRKFGFRGDDHEGHIFCQDEVSLRWAKEAVKSTPPREAGAPLFVALEPGEAEKYETYFLGVRRDFGLPLDFQGVRKMLQQQNPTLQWGKLRCWSTQTSGNFVTFSLGVDKELETGLAGLGFCPFLGLDRVPFRKASGKKSEGQEGGT